MKALKSETLLVRLDAELKRQLKEQAEAERRSASEVMRYALVEYLERVNQELNQE